MNESSIIFEALPILVLCTLISISRVCVARLQVIVISMVNLRRDGRKVVSRRRIEGGRRKRGVTHWRRKRFGLIRLRGERVRLRDI
ncbi:hypothetical protein DFH05DRAFT_1511820 [Lentinula detonsa]|uniref:Uncharacterized protein n=1 Tax=Lentinula detonsa TaxID=2804962 RepID=A0A9W8TTU7_9AGAR|nr:hypothetical protein DFH05DRAFT_1511820 [Lentinula detonsa]